MGKEIQLEKEGGGVGFQEVSLKNVSKNLIPKTKLPKAISKKFFLIIKMIMLPIRSSRTS